MNSRNIALKTKSILKGIISKTGYQIEKIKTTQAGVLQEITKSYRDTIDDLEFDFISPYGTYAPWLQDKKFLELYSKIKSHTLVDMYRCYELWDIVEMIYKIDNSVSFIEVGVWKGGTSAIIARKLQLLNAKAPFYIADTFTGVVKASDKDFKYNGGEHSDTSVETVLELLADKYSNLKVLKGIFPDQTAINICESEKFGFCHIDVDVYESAKDIVDWIWNRLIPGGVIIFDDYAFASCTGIIKYVNEQKKEKDRIVLYNLNGHAVMIKVKNLNL